MNAMKKFFWLHALLLALLLSSCGGSVTRVEPFVAQAVVVFGDELSLLSGPDSYRYGVNVLDTTTTPIKPNCSLNPVWSQVVASNFGFGFPGCKIDAVATVLAQPGATVANVATQIQNYTGGFTSKTLITVMAGMHDIVTAYTDCSAGRTNAAGAIEQVKAAGAQLGNLINSMAANGVGGRVVFVTVPDPLLTPQGRGISNAGAGFGGCVTAIAAVARSGKDFNSCDGKGLACSFNTALRTTVVNDGRYVAIVTADELTNLMTTTPGNYGFGNVTDAACDAALSNMDLTPPVFCTTSTLVAGTGGNPLLYLWADGLRPGPTWHSRVGSAAVTRARNNPF
jgi:phospholipase/lecithinase/hemolysin